MLEVHDVDRYYGARRAVSALSFSLEPGQCVGVLGLNGAGKSTTLRMLAGVLSPTRGSVRLDGQALHPGAHALRARIGFLPDRAPVYGEMRVADYLVFAARLRGISAGDVSMRVGEVLDACDLESVRDEPIDTLSHGFRQRVGIAQAIVHAPALLVLDEPSQGLDPAQRLGMRELLRRLRARHTLVLSTHLLNEISQSCDRILWIHEGKLLAEGTEAQLVSRFVGGTRRLTLLAKGQAEPLMALLAGLSGVSGLRLVREEPELEIELSAQADARARVSRCVVESGAELLELSSRGAGLEAVFASLTEQQRDARGQP